MFSTILSALLPVVLTMLLGYFAGRHHDFTSDQATVLNRLVLLYALPADLFVGMATTRRSDLFDSIPLIVTVVLTIVISFGATFIFFHKLRHKDPGASSLYALGRLGAVGRLRRQQRARLSLWGAGQRDPDQHRHPRDQSLPGAHLPGLARCASQCRNRAASRRALTRQRLGRRGQATDDLGADSRAHRLPGRGRLSGLGRTIAWPAWRCHRWGLDLRGRRHSLRAERDLVAHDRRAGRWRAISSCQAPRCWRSVFSGETAARSCRKRSSRWRSRSRRWS